MKKMIFCCVFLNHGEFNDVHLLSIWYVQSNEFTIKFEIRFNKIWNNLLQKWVLRTEVTLGPNLMKAYNMPK